MEDRGDDARRNRLNQVRQARFHHRQTAHLAERLAGGVYSDIMNSQ